MRATWTAVLFIGATLLVGCGGGDADSAGAASAPPAETPQAAKPASPPAESSAKPAKYGRPKSGSISAEQVKARNEAYCRKLLEHADAEQTLGVKLIYPERAKMASFAAGVGSVHCHWDQADSNAANKVVLELRMSCPFSSIDSARKEWEQAREMLNLSEPLADFGIGDDGFRVTQGPSFTYIAGTESCLFNGLQVHNAEPAKADAFARKLVEVVSEHWPDY